MNTIICLIVEGYQDFIQVSQRMPS